MLLEKRFWNKVNKTTSCWLWTGTRSAQGYGFIRVAGKNLYAHRVSFEIQNRRKLGRENVVRHTCDVPSCVNPDHLRVGTQLENVADMWAKGRATRVAGERNGNAKLTWTSVTEMRLKLQSGRGKASLAREYGVSAAMVTRISQNKAWVP